MSDMHVETMGWDRFLGVLAAFALAVTTTACGSNSGGSSPGSSGGGSSDGGSASGASSGSGGSDGGAGAGGGTGSGGGAIGGASGADGASCQVDGVVYPHGATGVPDPASCNTCECDDGQLTACTEIACPDSCPRNHDFGTQCAQCGPVDECLVVEHGCFEVCDGVGDCRDGICNDGVCVQLCG